MKKITLKQVKDMAKQVVKELPDRENPRSKRMLVCLYTSSTGKHCFAGEVMSRLGTPVPKYKSCDNDTALYSIPKKYTEPYTEEALGLLIQLQLAADMTFGGKQAKWGTLGV